MARFALTLLGAFEVTVYGQGVTRFATDKARALLAFLALEPAMVHRREILAGLLWPEIADRLALTNLRQTLHRLRSTLDDVSPGSSDALFTTTRQTIQLNHAQCVVDAAEFQSQLVAYTTHDHTALASCDVCLATLTQAVTLYQGELLAGFGLADAPAFEEWLLLRRETLHHQAMLAVHHLADAHEVWGRVEQALHYAQRKLALDSYREDTHRQVMRLLAKRGLAHQALAQFESCRRLLRDEMGVEPDTETVALMEQIRSGHFDHITMRQAARMTKSPAHPVTLSPPHNLPSQLTPLVGRERELDTLSAHLQRPDIRLLTLVGAGGVGKPQPTKHLYRYHVFS